MATSMRTRTAPSGSLTRAPPEMGAIGVVAVSPSRGDFRHRLDAAKPRAAGISAKSPSFKPRSDRLSVLALDVTDADSIHRCVEATGSIDALVNNAGISVLAPLEGADAEAH